MKEISNSSPLFLVFDGMDGVGKTTQMHLLAERLRSEGQQVMTTAEPTDFPDGLRLREALAGRQSVSREQMAAMFLLDRIGHNQHETRGIQQALNTGVAVLCDRYYYSSMAYQGVGHLFEWVAQMNTACPAIRHPDAGIFFDLSADDCMKRIQKNRRAEELEIFETLAKQEEIRTRYRLVKEWIAQHSEEPIYTVDAAGTIQEVAARVWEVYQTVRCTRKEAE